MRLEASNGGAAVIAALVKCAHAEKTDRIAAFPTIHYFAYLRAHVQTVGLDIARRNAADMNRAHFPSAGQAWRTLIRDGIRNATRTA